MIDGRRSCHSARRTSLSGVAESIIGSLIDSETTFHYAKNDNQILRLRFASRRMTGWAMRVDGKIWIFWEVDESDKTECSLIHCQPSILSFCTEDIFVRSCRIRHGFCNRFWDFVLLCVKWQLGSATSLRFAQNDQLSAKRVRREILKYFEFDESDKTQGPWIHWRPSNASFCTEDFIVRSCRIQKRLRSQNNISRLSAHILKQINQQS